MLMLGGMYAPSDDVTLMFMTMFMDKSMNLNTYHAMMRNNIGSFNSSSSDLSDLSFSALVNINEQDKSRWHAEIGLNFLLEIKTKRKGTYSHEYHYGNGSTLWHAIRR